MTTTKKRRLTAKDYMAMNAKQLAEATADLDEEFASEKTRPLTAEEKEQWAKAKRKRGRPKVGRGATTIAVSIERNLLAKATRLAGQQNIDRSKLIAKGLLAMLAENSKH